MSISEWRFPDNGYTTDSGLDTSDMEMFKKDPLSSLAREICQNSIDASFGEKPVRVVFSLFEISREDIPGIGRLTSQINACYEYKQDSPKEGPTLKALKESIERSKIMCLRISDFNTSGAVGATTNERGTPFYNLTKGSGVSDKGGSSGGSKGIGKFASFVVSTTNTVFYSTRANDGSCGYIGISKLRSTPIPEKDPELLTMGIGYYCADDKNHPILEELHLDKDFCRKENEFGTDVYVIGFNCVEGWESDIITKVLDSFMVAVMRGDLEVIVGNTTVTRDTVKEIIYGDAFQKGRTKTELKEIRAQYELLQRGDAVTVEELKIDGENTVTVYIKQYTQQDEANATKHCVMVRYPYMKITNFKTSTYLPFSALCIINDNELNRKLRDIENPQHTGWEIKRLNDFPEQKRSTKSLKKALETAVVELIKKVLRDSSEESTDIEGAGEFLPSQDELGSGEGSSVDGEQVKIKAVTPIKTPMPKTQKAGEAGESDEFGEGAPDDFGEDGKPIKESKHKPKSNSTPKDGSESGVQIGPGKSTVLKPVPLSGMRFRTVVTDKAHGKYDCIFTSLYDENDCEFFIRLYGEAADKYPIEILDATIDGAKCIVREGKIVGMRIEKGKTYKISYTVNSTEMFASEVVLNANR